MPKNPTDQPTLTEQDLTWDGSPLTRYAWQKDLPRRLTRANPAFRTLCEYGYVLERGRVICSTPTHRDNLYHNNVARCTFRTPCKLLSFTRINDALAVTPVPAESATRYAISPELLLATDSRLFEEIAETISNHKRREDYYHLAAGSGIALLDILNKELSQQAPEIGAWAAGEIANLQLTGIAAPTVAAFDEYRDRYEDLNGQLDSPATDASLAAHYFAQVRRLGDLLANNLKLRMSTESASGDLGKTVSVITAVLNEEEASHGTGRALYGARDPPRGKAKGKGKGKGTTDAPKRVWVDGKDELCSVCNGEADGGRHLRKDCPRNSNPRPTGGRGGARAASSYPLFDCGDDDAIILDTDAILKAFEDGLPNASEAASARAVTFGEDGRSEPDAATGAARVARGVGRGQPPQSPPFTPSPSCPAQETTPSTQSSVERLHHNSPILEMRSVARELGVHIDLSVGGKSRRTKFEVLQDLRHAAGLSPAEPPTGIPLGRAGFPGVQETPTKAGAPTPAPALVASTDTGWPWTGGPPRSLVCTVADGHGGALLQHTFATTWSTLRDAAPSTFTSPLDGPQAVDCPPAGSVWLGSRASDGMQLWGQRDGTLVRSMPGKPAPSTGQTTIAGTTSAARVAAADNSSSPSATSGLGASTIAALIVALGSLLTIAGGSPDG